MSLKEIIFGLRVDKTEYDEGMAEARRQVEELDSQKLENLQRQVKDTGRELEKLGESAGEVEVRSKYIRDELGRFAKAGTKGTRSVKKEFVSLGLAQKKATKEQQKATKEQQKATKEQEKAQRRAERRARMAQRLGRFSEVLGTAGLASEVGGFAFHGLGMLAQLRGSRLSRSTDPKRQAAAAKWFRGGMAARKVGLGLGKLGLGLGGASTIAGVGSLLLNRFGGRAAATAGGGPIAAAAGLATVEREAKAARRAVQELDRTGLQHLTRSANGAAKAVAGVNGGGRRGLVGRMGGGIMALGGGLMAGIGMLGAPLAAGALALGGGALALGGILGFRSMRQNMSLETILTTFTSMTGGNVGAAKAIVSMLRRDADKSPFDTEETIGAGLSLFTSAGNDPQRMMEFVKLAQRLAVLNPNAAQGGGLEGAAFALKEAVAGDFMSLRERFNIGGKEIEALREQGLSGDQIVATVLNRRGITDQSVEALGKTMEGRISTIKAFLADLQRRLGAALFGDLSSFFGRVGDWIDTHGDKVRDIATGVGLALKDGFYTAWNFARKLWTGLQEIAVLVQGYGAAAWEWLKELPRRLIAAFQSGELVQMIMAMIGGIIKGAVELGWEALKLLGNMARLGIMSALPGIAAAIGKVVVDALRGALGKRASRWLGLDKASKTLGEYTAEKTRETVGIGAELLKDFGRTSAEIVKRVGGGMWEIYKEYAGSTMGVNQMLAQGAANAAAIRKRQISTPGWLERQRQRGEMVRRKEEWEEQVGLSSLRTAPQAPQAKARDMKVAQEAENYNAAIQGRRPVNLREREKALRKAGARPAPPIRPTYGNTPITDAQWAEWKDQMEVLSRMQKEVMQAGAAARAAKAPGLAAAPGPRPAPVPSGPVSGLPEPPMSSYAAYLTQREQRVRVLVESNQTTLSPVMVTVT